MSSRAYLWGFTALLLVYLAARFIALTAFPPFVDEAFHINFGREVLRTGPLAYSSEGRQFVVWLYILFGAPTNAPYWSARVANLFVLLLGFAGVIGMARLLSNRWAGLFAAALLIFSPYHNFFERLALADPVSGAAVALAIYFAARLSKRADLSDAILCGALLFIACGAKISALPFLMIPVIAALCLRRTRAGTRWMIVALLTAFALTGIYLGVLFWRGYNPFFYLQTGRSAPLLDIILTNIRHSSEILIGYFGVPAAVFLLAAPVILIVRRRLFLPLCLLLPLAIFWFSPRQVSRHLFAPMTLLLLCGAVVLGDLVEKRPALRLALLAAVLIWGLALWLPFIAADLTSPSSLPVPAADRAEYITSEGGGFGLDELIAVLSELHPKRVIGVLANCFSLRDIAPFPVECPRLNPTGEDKQALSALLASSRAPGTYAILETLAYAPDTAPGKLMSVIDIGRPRLSIYDLAP